MERDGMELGDYIDIQFGGREEFAIVPIAMPQQGDGEARIWEGIRKAVAGGMENDEELIILSGEEHRFTKEYSRDELIRQIMEAYGQRAEILSGGVGEFDVGIPVGAGRFWISSLSGLQFLVLYRNIFQRILDHQFTGEDSAAKALSAITSYKMVLFPFISERCVKEDREVFIRAGQRLEQVRRVYDEWRVTVYNS
jgi:glycosyl transferase family 25